MWLRRKVQILIVFLVVVLIGQWLVFRNSEIVLLTVLVGGVLVFQLESYYRVQRRFEEQSWKHYGQIEALFFLHGRLRLRYPLPAMRGWAISPDFANILVSLIHERKPKRIVELGSGASTLISGYCLEEIGQGQVISLDHERQYAEATRAAIEKHELQRYATVLDAPLVKHEIGNASWQWYSTEQVKNVGTIDMLVVDGPPESTQRMARYPALPLLVRQLNEDAVILLDDALRPDEQAIVQRWLQEVGQFEVEQVAAEKGATVLRRRVRSAVHVN